MAGDLFGGEAPDQRESGAYQWDAINQAVADTYIRLIRQKQRRRD